MARKLKIFKINADKVYYVGAYSAKGAASLLKGKTTENTEISEVTGLDLDTTLDMGLLGEMTFNDILSWISSPGIICTAIQN